MGKSYSWSTQQDQRQYTEAGAIGLAAGSSLDITNYFSADVKEAMLGVLEFAGNIAEQSFSAADEISQQSIAAIEQANTILGEQIAKTDVAEANIIPQSAKYVVGGLLVLFLLSRFR